MPEFKETDEQRFSFPSLDGRLLDTKLSLDLKISLGLRARKDAEGLRKALLRGRPRKQLLAYLPFLEYEIQPLSFLIRFLSV